ncbi:MAG: two pore domain potassium channel family protein [Rhodoferax sp.]|jgi:hypothetical protein|nr:two pore domain potassium channel family protein [Rhodoferax sp.]
MLVGIMTLHSFGMGRVMHRFETKGMKYAHHPSELKRQFFFGHLVAMMLLTHLLEIFAWGLLLYAVGALPDLRTAFYFSGETYTTLGLGDVILPPEWRQIISLIAISGVFAFGWTTGVLVKIVDKFYEVRLAKRQQMSEGDKN